MKKKKKIFEIIRKIILGICVVTFLVSGGLLGYELYNYYHKQAKDDELIKEVEQVGGDWREKWKSLKAQNDDFYAWLEWESGLIDTPIMKEQENNENFYMTHDFYKDRVLGGGAFITSYNDREENQNLVIYGHAVFMYGRKTMPIMFSPLLELTDQDEFDVNRKFWLHFENEDQEYELVYVCDVQHYSDEWDWEKKDFGSKEEFDEWQISAINKNVVDTDTELTYNDTLVTFQTCQQLNGAQRLVLIAKRIA